MLFSHFFYFLNGFFLAKKGIACVGNANIGDQLRVDDSKTNTTSNLIESIFPDPKIVEWQILRLKFLFHDVKRLNIFECQF